MQRACIVLGLVILVWGLVTAAIFRYHTIVWFGGHDFQGRDVRAFKYDWERVWCWPIKGFDTSNKGKLKLFWSNYRVVEFYGCDVDHWHDTER